MLNIKSLYLFFSILALNIFFFSTTNVSAKAFLIEDIKISEPFENNFNKNAVIDQGFKDAFLELINSLIKSSDVQKINLIDLNVIKSMIQSFSIKEEKFINETYYVNLGVSFDKKKVFKFLEKNNIFPTQIIKKTFLVIPIIINQKNDDITMFSNNPIYQNWNNFNKKTDLIDYLLLTEDLEDFNLVKDKSNIIEQYDFKEIIEKYYLDHSIVLLIFRNENSIKALSRININNETIIKNSSFKLYNFENKDEIGSIILNLKMMYEDLWKERNQINTSIKLPLIIKVDNKNLYTSISFEKTLEEVDLISGYTIKSFDKDHIYYEVEFNGTPKNFIQIMDEKKYNFDTQKKIWILK
ncbi:hypothetical protein OA107_02750 [Candidatus Pelagibacter sp.]|nr:hypothetical protein [Candidatus Pelagibacter sp.]